MMSRADSRPTETRNNASLMPVEAFTSGGTDKWVLVAE